MNIEISQEKEDINNMAIILDSLVHEVNIFEGLEEEDALLVSDALNDYLKENKFSRPDYERETNDINNLVETIKSLVDDLNEKKKISLMEMKYSENKIFSFGKKCVYSCSEVPLCFTPRPAIPSRHRIGALNANTLRYRSLRLNLSSAMSQAEKVSSFVGLTEMGFYK